MSDTTEKSKQITITEGLEGLQTASNILRISRSQLIEQLKPMELKIKIKRKCKKNAPSITETQEKENQDNWQVSSRDTFILKSNLSAYSKQFSGLSDMTKLKINDSKASLIEKLEGATYYDLQPKSTVVLSANSDCYSTEHLQKSLKPESLHNREIKSSNNKGKVPSPPQINDGTLRSRSELTDYRSEEIEDKVKVNKQKSHQHLQSCKSKIIDAIIPPGHIALSESCNENVTYSLQSQEENCMAKEKLEMQRICILEKELSKLSDKLNVLRQVYLAPKDVDRFNDLRNELQHLISALTDLKHSFMIHKFQDILKIALIRNSEDTTNRQNFTTQGTMTEEFFLYTWEYEKPTGIKLLDISTASRFSISDPTDTESKCIERIDLDTKCQEGGSLNSKVEHSKGIPKDSKGQQNSNDCLVIDSKPLLYDVKNSSESTYEQRRKRVLRKPPWRNKQNTSVSENDNLTFIKETFAKNVCPLKYIEYKKNRGTIMFFSGCQMCAYMEIPILKSDLREAVHNITKDIKPSRIALTIVLQQNNLYHVNISILRKGQSLACLYATEECIVQAKRQHLFNKYLVFFAMSFMNTVAQKNKILSHSLDFTPN